MPGLEDKKKPEGVSQATWDRITSTSKSAAELVSRAVESKDCRIAVIDMTNPHAAEIKLLGNWQGTWITATQKKLRQAYDSYRASQWRKLKKEEHAE